ncbi:HNH endonuclease signature motif containing protein [Sediminitomix flava]|uniref:HNH endonuclease n=1 Tax=Sediminitomix flava TaxID=379075 RepID=A0A315ZG57_SEDFL|nr:HNH endonuclease signature motif containing protein [Sediminitomix flava]PWJ44129.1 HNH endonuclease [Sediminitomix flava]
MRNRNTNGQDWRQDQIDAVWKKAKPILGYSPNEYRRDVCGGIIRYTEYGNEKSEWGWEIDHIKPTVIGGDDELTNLQALNWQNNKVKGNDYPSYTYAVKHVNV